ncbi:hypothetical protein [Magnetospirillum aberrantis]|uniref:CopL family metal-binding regulatory protein n=1 Tax=Magnetospirillum aberrantis SpK TaxID=908842 RepID=A0A7C9UZA9_9PROT|nr:hypothetical protein [Magnetospirillum aberrantis]NFV80214.1 hypothetical protein [Magnetospirillum aberrantis SpK]
MTICARLRVLLAILALVLVPLWAPARPAVAMAAMPMTDIADCDHHACDGDGVPVARHADAACALGCLQASLPPLLMSAPFGLRPVTSSSRVALPVLAFLPSRHPSPLERPPRT